MKKLFISALVAMGVIAVNAQNTLAPSKLTDNISVTIKGGATTPLQFTDDFVKDTRAVIGAEVRKQITPIFGLGAEGNWSINTDGTNTYIFDHSYVGVFGTANLSNLFCGYKGAPRNFEIETVLGAGWIHAYVTEWKTLNGRYNGYDKNAFGVKAGLNFNYNFGSAKQWTASLKPAIVWDMDHVYGKTEYPGMNKNYAGFEVQAGITYHFKNSNGTHHFALAKLYDQAEVDGLNGQINDLRAQLAAQKAATDECNTNAAALQAKVAQLEADLAACMARQPEVLVKQDNTLNTVRYVFFKQGRSTVSADQLPNVEQIATYLKNHPAATVVIKGYASPEGNADVNAKIAAARAESVKTSLVKKYKIAASRISAEGQGVGEMFSEPDWNRVSICTINENEKK
jgi:outer membrane protein OmpA-like peptidoglycan-associated protein